MYQPVDYLWVESGISYAQAAHRCWSGDAVTCVAEFVTQSLDDAEQVFLSPLSRPSITAVIIFKDLRRSKIKIETEEKRFI